MNRIVPGLAGAFSLLMGACQAQSAEPTQATAAICRPSFTTVAGRLDAGTAFLLKPSPAGETLLVTAQHLFGPGGGLEKDIPWDRMAEEVSGVTCRPFAKGPAWTAKAPLEIRDARTVGETGVPRDMAAFLIAAPTRPLTLAATAPAVGGRVWLVAQLVGGAPPEQLLHPAVVARNDEGMMYILYDNPQLEIRATSGAPVVNAAGEVVGLNYGGGKTRKGDMVGMVQDLTALRAGLAAIQR